MRRRALLGGTAALALGCRRGGSDDALVVFAAASLREVVGDVATAFTGRSRVAVRPTYDATSRLVRQIVDGAACDLFLSADETWMDYLEKEGEVASVTRRALATTDLVVVVPRGADARLTEPAHLVSVARLALAGENVPAGRYARAALRATGVWDRVEAKVVSGDNVRVALEWVARGEAQAGVVYATDPAGEPRVRVAFAFAAGTHPPVRYPGATLRRAKRPRDAAALLDAFSAEEGKRAFVARGFRPLP